jgi:hypothetical protein
VADDPPPLLLDVARGTQHLTYIRYTLLASPALYAVVAALRFDRRDNAGGDATALPRRRRRRWIAHLAPALIALACLLSLPHAYEAWWKADWRSLAGQIDRHRQPGDVVVFLGRAHASDPNSNFLYSSFYRRAPFGPTVLMDRPPTTRSRNSSRPSRRACHRRRW